MIAIHQPTESPATRCLASGDVARRAGCSVPWLGEGLCRWQRPVPPLNPPEMLEGPVAGTGGSSWEWW